MFLERFHLLLVASSTCLLHTFIACFRSLSSVVDSHTHTKQSRFALVFSHLTGLTASIAYPLLENGTQQLSLATFIPSSSCLTYPPSFPILAPFSSLTSLFVALHVSFIFLYSLFEPKSTPSGSPYNAQGCDEKRSAPVLPFSALFFV